MRRHAVALLLFGAGVLGVNVMMSGLVGGNARAAEAAPRTAEVQDTTNCLMCHDMVDGFTHPVDITPSMRVPGTFPLSNGRMTCETCHEGDLAHGHSLVAGTGNFFLRMPEESGSMCGACHIGGFGRGAHGTGSLRAHLAVSDVRGSRAGIDEESRACIGCHDGVTASDAGAHPVLRRAGDDDESALGSDHPIGVIFNEGKIAPDAGGMKPVRLVDHRVRLFNRTVGCGSCHSVYAKHEALLVMSNRGSALCVSCHAI